MSVSEDSPNECFRLRPVILHDQQSASDAQIMPEGTKNSVTPIMMSLRMQ